MRAPTATCPRTRSITPPRSSSRSTRARIAELEDKLARAEVIDVSKLSGDTIKFGATVTLVDEDTDKKQVWQIVGEPEADAKAGRISITSPLARALINKKKGESVEVVDARRRQGLRDHQDRVEVARAAFHARSRLQIRHGRPCRRPSASWRSCQRAGAMKFGIFDHIDDAGMPLGQLYADRLTIAEAYDRAGFYGYHVAEHHTTPLGAAASPALIFAALAQRTKKLRFGPMVYLLPFYHPLRLIEEVCMLDQMSGGRFQLGVGRGVSMYETAAYGLDFAKTQAMYHEAFQVLLQGPDVGRADFHGEFYKFDKLPMVLKPVQKPHPPLWYGVTLAGQRRLAGREPRQHRRARAARQHQRDHQGLSRRRAQKHGFDPDGTLIGVEPPRRGRRHRRGGAGDRAARLSALARRASAGCSPATAPSRASSASIRRPSTS